MSKEDKFFESLRDFAGFTGRVGFLLEETAEGKGWIALPSNGRGKPTAVGGSA